MIKEDDLDFLNSHPVVKQWLLQKLQESGCWNNKQTIKTKINCLLHYVLGGIITHHEIRGYLNDNDEDGVWQQSIVTIVAPYLVEQGVV